MEQSTKRFRVKTSKLNNGNLTCEGATYNLYIILYYIILYITKSENIVCMNSHAYTCARSSLFDRYCWYYKRNNYYMIQYNNITNINVFCRHILSFYNKIRNFSFFCICLLKTLIMNVP